MRAAEEVFTQKGFDQARMDDIAGRTGPSKGTLYLDFKSKDDLITAILDRIIRREFSQLEQLEEGEATATETLRKLTDLLTKDLLGMLRILPIIYNFLAMAFRNKYVQQALKGYINRYLSILTPVIQRGIDTGEFRAGDAREVAIAMAGVVEGTLLLWVYDRSLIDPERHIRSGVELILEGVQMRR
ncbi:MAG: TetR/AcrR family transcriptional regulator [Bacteroidota bacterium]